MIRRALVLGAASLVFGVLASEADPAGSDRPPREEPVEETPDDDPGPAPDAAPLPTRAPLVYQPPRRGAPRARVGGGVRAASRLPNLLTLAPEHVARTIHGQPSLFWYIDDAAPPGVRVVFTLIEETRIEPLVEIGLTPPTGPGVQRVRLAEHDIVLQPDVEYAWSVALVLDEWERSRDMVSTAYLRRIEDPALAARTPDAETYAAAGLWYDALESATDALDARPGDAALRERRDSLLRQADLVAAID